MSSLVDDLNLIANKQGAVVSVLQEVAERLSALFGLPCVVGDTASEQAFSLVQALQATWLRSAVIPAAEEAALLLGLAVDTQGEQSSVKRRKAAVRFRVEQDDWATWEYLDEDTAQESYRRRRQRFVLGVFADQLQAYCQAVTSADSDETIQGINLANVNLPERYEWYFRIWTPVYALRADLHAALADRHDNNEGGYERFLMSSLYWYARARFWVDRHTLARGGIWIMPTAATSTEVGDAVAVIWHASPLAFAEDSWLQRCISRARFQNYDHFIEVMRQDPERSQSVEAGWRTWLERCQCDGRQASEDCNVHRLIAACWRYVTRIEETWHQVVEWYHELPLGLQGVDLASLSDQVRLRTEETKREAEDRRRLSGEG